MKFYKSFKHAVRGVWSVLKTEANFKIQLGLCGIVILLGFLFSVTYLEWMALSLCAAMVLVLEMINTAVEKVLDVFKPRLDERVALIKDIMAGAVLIGSLAACTIGLLVFLPYFIER